MRVLSCALTFVFLASAVTAQSFECQTAGALPSACCSDCEDAWTNSASGDAIVDTSSACGMPFAGLQYARATANGMSTAGPGIPRPIGATVTEIKVLVPSGADGVSFKWNWFNAEATKIITESTVYNDGLEIAIVAPDGVTVLVPLVYVDTFSALAPGFCVDSASFGLDVLGDGVESLTASFAPVPFGSYLSIVSFNGGDTAVDSAAVIDCIAWGDPTFPSYELGDPFGPRVVDLTPATSFRIGLPTTIRVEAGIPFAEGFHCMVMQANDFSTLPQFIVPGIAGGLYIRLNRPTVIMSEGLLLGGILAGTAGRGPDVTFTISDPSLCGVGLLIQAYVIAEDLTIPTFTTALFGWLR
jgi:hypothetical protein